MGEGIFIASILLVKLSARNNPRAACLLTIIFPFPAGLGI